MPGQNVMRNRQTTNANPEVIATHNTATLNKSVWWVFCRILGYPGRLAAVCVGIPL